MYSLTQQAWVNEEEQFAGRNQSIVVEYIDAHYSTVMYTLQYSDLHSTV